MAMRRDARQLMIDRATSAWRNANPMDARRKKPPPDDDDDDDADDCGSRGTARDARTAARDAYLDMVRRAESAWRKPVRDFAEPDQGSRPEDLQLLRRGPGPHDDPGAAMRAHMQHAGPGSDQPGESETARARAYEDYKDRISSAWKASPGAAPAIERRMELERGKGER
jgi:hypothetical protein